MNELAGVGLVVGVLVCGYWYFVDITPPMYVVDNDTQDIGTVRPDDLVIIKRNLCVRNDKNLARVVREFEDGSVTLLPPIVETDPGVGCKERFYTVRVPRGLANGRYVYRVWNIYRLNPLISELVVMLPPVIMMVEK